MGWTKAYAVTEFGPVGHWQSATTNWGAYLEQTSAEKIDGYVLGYEACVADPRCVGSFPFVWGWKWEKTGTWYNLFNEWEEVGGSAAGAVGTEMLAALKERWTSVAVPRPTIDELLVGGASLRSFTIGHGEAVTVEVAGVGF